MWFKPIFEFLTLEGEFLGVKNNSKNFGKKKIIAEDDLIQKQTRKLKVDEVTVLFMIKNAHLLKILLYNPLYFLFPKFLELFFTPKYTPPKVKNSKLDKRSIFWDTLYMP